MYLSSGIFSLADNALFGQQKHAAASFSWLLAMPWHSCSPRPLNVTFARVGEPIHKCCSCRISYITPIWTSHRASHCML